MADFMVKVMAYDETMDFIHVFDPISAPCWLHFKRLWAPSGLDLGGFYFHSGANLALSSGTWAQERDN